MQAAARPLTAYESTGTTGCHQLEGMCCRQFDSICLNIRTTSRSSPAKGQLVGQVRILVSCSDDLGAVRRPPSPVKRAMRRDEVLKVYDQADTLPAPATMRSSDRRCRERRR